MRGPTGVGKTEIARRLAKLVKAPFLKVEATKYTEVGYVKLQRLRNVLHLDFNSCVVIFARVNFFYELVLEHSFCRFAALFLFSTK